MINRYAIQNQKGFTLIEILMVAFMLALVLGSLYTLYTTHHRTAYVQDEVVDVQQNLRIAMDAITRDLRHTGFLTAQYRPATPLGSNPNVQNGNSAQPIQTAGNNAVGIQMLPTPRLPNTADANPNVAAGVHADYLVLNTSSVAGTFAKILTRKSSFAAGGNGVFEVYTADSLRNFAANDRVRIINVTTHDQETNAKTSETATWGGVGTIFQVVSTDTAVVPPTITLQFSSGTNLVNAEFRSGSIIARIDPVGNTYPDTITYCLGPTAAGAIVQCNLPLGTTCNQLSDTDQTLCLIRITSNVSQVVASRISGLQLSYLLDDGTEVPNAVTPIAPSLPDLGAIRAVRVTITGQTAHASALAGGREKTRVMTSVIKMQNRMKDL